MRKKRTNKYSVYLISTVLTTGILGSAHARDKDPGRWNSTLGVYLWATGIAGTSQTEPATAPIEIAFRDAVENLAPVLTLHYESQKNQWGVLVDCLHIEIDPSAALPDCFAVAS